MVKRQRNCSCRMGCPQMIGDLHFHRGYSLRLQESKPLKNNGIIRCIIDYHTRQLYAEGREQFWNIGEARPPLAEEAAVRRMLLLAQRTGSPLYIVHVSGKDSVHAITDARAAGVEVFAEVLHPNLVFDPELYKLPQGQRYMNYPPNKTQEHREALWAARADRRIHTVASDDFTIPLAAKISAATVDNVTAGTNSAETRMAAFGPEG